MKKLLILGLLSAGLSINAAEMSFITVLSSPVGSFNRLEAVDFSAPASASAVNFCTKVGSSGSVQLKGLQSASLGAVALASGTRLGRSGAGDYVLNSIRLNSDGAVEGGRLLANNVTVSGQGVGKSSNLYGTTLTVAGAKTTKLNVGGGKSVMSGTGSATEMVWSNEYQNDAACNNATGCPKQYLLKSKGTASSGGSSGGGVNQPFYTYQWTLGYSGCVTAVSPDSVLATQQCGVTCPVQTFSTEPYPQTLDANVFGGCNNSRVNHSCIAGKTLVEHNTSGYKYCCVKYTCTAIKQ